MSVNDILSQSRRDLMNRDKFREKDLLEMAKKVNSALESVVEEFENADIQIPVGLKVINVDKKFPTDSRGIPISSNAGSDLADFIVDSRKILKSWKGNVEDYREHYEDVKNQLRKKGADFSKYTLEEFGEALNYLEKRYGELKFYDSDQYVREAVAIREFMEDVKTVTEDYGYDFDTEALFMKNIGYYEEMKALGKMRDYEPTAMEKFTPSSFNRRALKNAPTMRLFKKRNLRGFATKYNRVMDKYNKSLK